MAKEYTEEELARILAEIVAQAGGPVSPEDILEAARNPEHPLHDYLEWDDAKAAHAGRLEQAEGFIQDTLVEEIVEGFIQDTS